MVIKEIEQLKESKKKIEQLNAKMEKAIKEHNEEYKKYCKKVIKLYVEKHE